MSAEIIAEGEHRLEVCQHDAKAFLFPLGTSKLSCTRTDLGLNKRHGL